MGSNSEPPCMVGESWECFLARRGIERDKAEPIHEIQWLRSERIRLMVEVERHRMTEEERRRAASAADFMSHPGIDPEPLAMLAEINALRGYLARTAPKEVGRD